MSAGGKGSSPRPFSVSYETYSNNYDNIFRKPSQKEIEDEKVELEENERHKASLDALIHENERLSLYKKI